jgi:hypothetical protein
MEGEKAKHGLDSPDWQARLHDAVVQAVADADWEMARVREKNSQKLQTNALVPRAPQDVASTKRRRGAQPGNGNAVKTGYRSAEMKAERRMLRSLKRRAKAAVRTVETFVLGAKRRGRPRKWW